jgi:hypothetical protein
VVEALVTDDAALTGPPPAARRWTALPTVVAVGCLAVLAALVLYLAGGPILADDFWFHLKMGEVYATLGPWLASDPLLYTTEGDPPAPHEWLFGVGLYGLERVVGLWGLRVVHALAVVGIVALVYSALRRQSRSVGDAAFATSVFLVLAWLRLVQLRPDLVSIAATIALYRLLLEPDEPPSWIRVGSAVALLVVWVNFHSLFAVGLLLLVAALPALVVRALLARWAAGREAPQGDAAVWLRRLGAALALGLVATLLNPRGVQQHLSFVTSARAGVIWQVPDDWEHFNPFARGPFLGITDLLAWLVMDGVLVAFLLAGVVGLVRFLRRPSSAALRGVDPVFAALGVAGVSAALVSIRFLWLSVFPLLFILRALRAALADRPRTATAVAWVVAAGGVALAVAFPRASAFPLVAEFLPARVSAYVADPYVAHKYHVEGVRFLRETGVEGRLFNKYAVGGFLGYWLAPRLRTFVDGRYPAGILKDYGAVSRQRGALPGESFLDVLERWRVDLFVGMGVPLGPGPDGILSTTAHLEGAPGWMLVSRSVHHAIYLRVNERNRENLDRVAAYYAREGVPFDPARGLDVAAVLRARPDWAVAHEMLPASYASLVAARTDPDPAVRFRALDYLGLVCALLGLYPESVQFDREAVALAPDALAPRRRLVYTLLRLGRWDEARAALEAIGRIAPEDALSQLAARQASAYARGKIAALQRPDLPSPPVDAALSQYPLVAEDERDRLLADFYHAKLD